MDEALRDLEELLAAAAVRPDLGRQRRAGVPEVILAEGKPPASIVSAVGHFLHHEGRALVSRASGETLQHLKAAFAESVIESYPTSRMVVMRNMPAPQLTGGRVGIITAGTTDAPVAEEAAVIAREMGCTVEVAYDVGVAGLHRLSQPLQEMLRADVDALVVAAGMDGALPSVIAGLVDVPVIGVPTSVGYGLGGKGLAALLSMLQTCSLGLAVVNIDNGIGAGAMAALIANRCAAARAAPHE